MYGIIEGTIAGASKGDTRSLVNLDYGSHESTLNLEPETQSTLLVV